MLIDTIMSLLSILVRGINCVFHTFTIAIILYNELLNAHGSMA